MEPYLFLIETRFPSNLFCNVHGVYINPLKYEVKHKGMTVEIRVISVNGIWGGSYSILTGTWGTSSGVSKRDLVFPTFDSCVEYLWNRIFGYIERNKKDATIVENQGSQYVKSEYKKWVSMTTEQKLKLFKQQRGYGKI